MNILVTQMSKKTHEITVKASDIKYFYCQTEHHQKISFFLLQMKMLQQTEVRCPAKCSNLLKKYNVCCGCRNIVQICCKCYKPDFTTDTSTC